MSPSPEANRPKPNILGYDLLRIIGSGSFGDVWLGRNHATSQFKAVKVVFRNRFTGDQKNFEREFNGLLKYAQIADTFARLMKIDHAVLHEEEGFFYYFMELADDVSGQRLSDSAGYRPKTLSQTLGGPEERARLPVQKCARIGIELAEALGQLHGGGLVHRDLKPSNIIFVRNLATLADVGLVAVAGEGQTFTGTEGYIAPEGPGTNAADIYALGKVLYEMGTGHQCKAYPALPEMGHMDDGERRQFRSLNAIICKACHRDPRQRYTSATALAVELRLLEAGESIEERRRLEQWHARVKKNLPRAAAALLLLVAVGVAVTWRLRHEAVLEAGRVARESLLREAQLRTQFPAAGWSIKTSQMVSNASGFRVDRKLLRDQAAAALAGLDAKPLFTLPATGGSSAIFARDGTLLTGGLADQPARLISSNHKVKEMATTGYGPVAFGRQETPLQFVVGSPGRLLLRNAGNGQVLREFTVEGDVIKEDDPVLALSPDGRRTAAGVKRGETNHFVVAWDVDTGTMLGEIQAAVSVLAFSTDGDALAVGRMDGRITVHALPGLGPIADLGSKKRRPAVQSLAFGADYLVTESEVGATNAGLLAAGHAGGGIDVWDLRLQERRAMLRGSLYEVSALAFSPDRITLASAGRFEVRLWDLPTQRALINLPHQDAGPDGRTFSMDFARGLAFSADGTRLAVTGKTGGLPGAVSVWEISEDRGLRVLRGLGTQVGRPWISPNGLWVAGLSHDWQLGIWSLATGRLQAVFEVPPGAVADNAGCAFDRDGTMVAFAAGREARLYDLAARKLIERWPLPLGYCDSLLFDPQGQLLLFRREQRDGDDRLRTWRLRHLQGRGARVVLEQSDTNWTSYITHLLPGAKVGVVLGYETPQSGTSPNWSFTAIDLNSGLEQWERRRLVGNGDLIWDATGRWLVYEPKNETQQRLLSVFDGKKHRVLPNCAAISSSKRWLALTSMDSKGQLVFPWGGETADSMTLGIDWHANSRPVFSADERYLVWATSEGVVLVADLAEVRRHLKKLNPMATEQ